MVRARAWDRISEWNNTCKLLVKVEPRHSRARHVICREKNKVSKKPHQESGHNCITV